MNARRDQLDRRDRKVIDNRFEIIRYEFDSVGLEKAEDRVRNHLMTVGKTFP